MGIIVMVVSPILKIAIYVLKSVNGRLFYTPCALYILATFRNFKKAVMMIR